MHDTEVHFQAARQRIFETPGDVVPLRLLVDAHGPAAQGSILVFMATPCLLPIPGAGTVMAIGIAAMAWAMW
jgi:hypothetical protein